MSVLTVALGRRSYPVVIERGVLARAAEHISAAGKWSSVVVLTHPVLARHYAGAIVGGLSSAGLAVSLVTLPAGEQRKSLRSLARLYDSFLAARVDRQGLIVTLGGGVLGDLGGFAAATYLRGIAYIQAPTTLLAQVDASVGGKTGVDLPQGKNLVGAFHQPRAVLIDLDTLRTLPLRELRAGLAEVVKYGIIRDKCLFARISSDMPGLLRRDPDLLSDAILHSCRIKAEVVAADETEEGERVILNFGHTIGHALESATGYARYRHGEAVAIGMVSACMIGEQLGVTPPDLTSELIRVLRSAGLPTGIPPDVSPETLIAAAAADKKSRAGKLRFVLARGIGDVIVTGDVPPGAVWTALQRQTGMGPFDGGT